MPGGNQQTSESAPAPPPTDADLLRVFLATRDEKCPRCGYNLRMLLAPICPECGDALVLRVGLENPRPAPLIVGLIGHSLGTGLNSLMIVFATVQLLRGRAPSWPEIYLFFGYNAGALVVQCAGLCIWIACWHRIYRMNVDRRWLAATTGWLLSLLNILIFAVLIR
jgi:hypothetical protein